MLKIQKTIIASVIGLSLSTLSIANEVPDSLIKKNSTEQPVPKTSQEDRIIINNKPVEQTPAPEIKNPETSGIDNKRNFAMNFRYNLKNYNVNTCYEPLSQIIKVLTDSTNIKSIETRNTLIESDKNEPVIFMDYAFITETEAQHSSIITSLQAIPFEDSKTCLLIETNDTILNNVENCKGVVEEADESGNSAFINEGDFKNQFEKNKYFRKLNNQLLTLNDIKDGGCHIRSVSYSQFTNLIDEEESE
jgi:hypothetical protein